jgi:hypothetical protein
MIRATLLTALLLVARGAAAAPDIVLVSIDTLRADRLGCYGYTRPNSPFLDSLAHKGLLFEETYTPLPATTPSHASMLTSLLPWRHGALTNAVPMNGKVQLLPEVLKRSGYRTAAAVAVAHIGRGHGFARGFDSFTEGEDDAARRPASTINADARKFVDAHVAAKDGKPLFLFLHYFDVHYPYRWWDPNDVNPTPFTAAELSNRSRQSSRYDDGVRHIDAAMRELHQHLTRKLGDDFIFVVTSDHGEQIGDHNYDLGHADIYRETVRVPLIITGPGIAKARVATPVSSMDIGVSLLELAGTRYTAGIDGIDLLATAARERNPFARAPKPRPFLVVGNALYTQSVLLIEGSKWYIRNFDHLYRHVATTTPAPDAAEERRWGNAPLHSVSDGTATFSIPYVRFEPYVLTIEHAAKEGACEATLNVLVSPSTTYLEPPLAFRKSARVVVAAARNDAIAVQVTPARCAGTTRYAVARYEGPDSIPAKTASHFYAAAVERKLSARNELYDIATDPLMLRNVLPPGGQPQTDRKLRAIFDRATATFRDRHATHRISDEEKKKLRSLGYIQ